MSSGKVKKCHQEMYKARTPPWKETYRKRCIERLRDSREKLQSRFRKLPLDKSDDNDTFIEDLMRDEWDCLRRERSKDVHDIESNSSMESFNVDDVLNMFEDIQADLRKEELQLLQEFDSYERSLSLEEQSLCGAIDKLSTEEVLCPLCQKHPLLTNKSVIFCKCGLRINTEQDCLTLSNVKRSLDHGMEEHGKKCDTAPIFSMMSEMGSSNLLMSCVECDWMSVVI